MMIRHRCPPWGSTPFKKKGYLPNGTQRPRCHAWGRQFGLPFEQRWVWDQERALMKRGLGERVSRHGLCRALAVTRRGLRGFMRQCYAAAPAALKGQWLERPLGVGLRRLDGEAAERQSCLSTNANTQVTKRREA